MNATTKVKLEDITPNLTCPLCKGYFVDATTIIECLHSFCKSCIVNHLDKSEYCPVCDVQLHSSKPLSSIRSDYMLQEIVYKLVPGLFQNEMERRRKFYKENAESTSVNQMDSGQIFNESYITSDDIICLSLELHSKNKEFRDNGKRYIKCPAAVSVSILKKFIQFKFDLSKEADIEVMYGDRILPDDFLLMDVAYKYSWTPNGKPLQLSYRVSGDPILFKPEKIQLEHADEEVMNATSKSKKLNGPKVLPLTPSNNPPALLTPKKSVKKSVSKIPKTNGEVRNPKAVKAVTTNGTPSPARGRKKKRVLDTEKELSRIRASVSESATQHDKEVQLRISENGTISARSVASGEEKIIVGTTGKPPATKTPEAMNGSLKPRLLGPQEANTFWNTNMTPTSIPRLTTEPKPRSNNGKIAIAKTPNGPVLLPKKNGTNNPEAPQITPIRHDRRPEDVKTGQQAQQGATFNRNMENLKAVTMRLRDELESKMNLFSAEITPIVNGTPPPKIVGVKPTEPQTYPAATLHTTDMNKAKGTNYNKRLHQTTIVNGDVKFTKNLLPSPQSKLLPKAKDSPKEKGNNLSPTGSPSKPPKFFKSRINLDASLGPTNFNGEPIKSPESTEATSPAAKKPRLAESPTPPVTSGGPLILPNQPSPRLPLPVNMNFNGIPLNFMPFVAANYASLPYLNNPAALKNVPVLGHPYFDFATQIHSLAQGLNGAMTGSSGSLHNGHTNVSTNLDLTKPNCKSPASKSTDSHAPSAVPSGPKITESDIPKASGVISTPVNKSLTQQQHRKVAESLSSSVLSQQTLLATINNLTTTQNNATHNSTKVSRKCLSPTKIPRILNVPIAPAPAKPVEMVAKKDDVATEPKLPAVSSSSAAPTAAVEALEEDAQKDSKQTEESTSESQRKDEDDDDESKRPSESSDKPMEETSTHCNNNEEIQCNNNNVEPAKESVVSPNKSPPSTPPKSQPSPGPPTISPNHITPTDQTFPTDQAQEEKSPEDSSTSA